MHILNQSFVLLILLSIQQVSAHIHENCISDVISRTHSGLNKRAADAVQFGYENEQNPSTWGQVSKTCNEGKQQSPVNFPDSSWLKDINKTGPKISWGLYENVELFRKPYTIEVELGEKMKTGKNRPTTLSFPYNSGETYELQQFHFHISSEHHVMNYVYPMEVHFVFKSTNNNFAVVGFFFDFSINGQCKLLTQMIDSIPKNATTGFFELPNKLDKKTKIAKLDLNILSYTYETSPKLYRYNGSLTTPPCNEDIQWTVVPKPLKASAMQLGSFYHSMPFNARFTQPLSSRN